MPTNAATFAASVRTEGKALPMRAFVPYRAKIVREILQGVVLQTPVDTGRARNGWHLTIGAPSGGSVQSTDALAAGLQVLADAKGADTIILQNNEAHTRVLEYGLFDPADPGPSKDPRPDRTGRVLVRGGFSTQAPVGMLGDTVQRVAKKYGLQLTAPPPSSKDSYRRRRSLQRAKRRRHRDIFG